MPTAPVSRLSKVLDRINRAESLPEVDIVSPWAPFPGFAITSATDRRSRERAWRLVHDAYCVKGYEAERHQDVRILLHDALPESTTFLAEQWPPADGPLATLTLVPDSPLGLPMDENCDEELDALRRSGRHVCEVAKLAVAEDADASGAIGSSVLLRLFRLAFLKARRLERATDLVASVVPHHARFYQKVLLFEPMGTSRRYNSVGGVEGMPLRLDLTTAEDRYRKRYDGRRGSRNLYRLFVNDEEPAILEWLRFSGGRMSDADLQHFMVERTDLLERASVPERMYLQSRYSTCDFDRMFLEATPLLSIDEGAGAR